jgi:hypothetical protein
MFLLCLHKIILRTLKLRELDTALDNVACWWRLSDPVLGLLAKIENGE